MALKRSLTERLLNMTRISTQMLSNCRISSSSAQSRIPQCPEKPSMGPHDPGDCGVFRRFLHKKALFHPAMSIKLRSPMLGENLIEKLKELDIAKNRIRLDGLTRPEENSDRRNGLTVEDARKLLRAAQLETVKSKLREVESNCIPYSEFTRICAEISSDREEASMIAKKLDESATVIILGNVVFLRPEQVAKALHGSLFVPQSTPSESARKELEEMHKQRAKIDEKAHTLVRRELWGGLGLFVAQTLAFMRLTFWELSWDVMEPICFFVTSSYFISSYAFFMRTSTEPSFERFYQTRFRAKQKRLMKLHHFDNDKYNELWKACHPNSSSPLESDPSLALQFNKSYQEQTGALPHF